MRKRYTALSLFLIFLSFGCSQQANDNQSQASVDELPELSVFNLPSQWINHHADSVKLADFRGKISIFAMIYTSCQAACPRLVADMRDIAGKIKPENKSKVNLILVSIDPEVDTPDKLGPFMIENELIQPYWHFLTGNLDTTREFAMVLGMKYKKVSPIDFSHSNIISLFDEQGELAYQQIGLGVSNERIVEEINARAQAL